MHARLEAQAGSLVARVLGVLRSPRTTLETVARVPSWLGVVTLTLLATTGCTAVLFETDVGQLALLDQWERTASAFGQTIDDDRYAAMDEASRHGVVYAALSSLAGGPLLAVGLAGLFFVAFRTAAPGVVTYRQVFAVVAHAGVILALREVIAAPLAYARETLSSPITLGMFMMLDETSWPARFFGLVDLFLLWWIVVLAIGMSVLYRRPVRRLAGLFVGAYVILAVVLTVVMAVTGGTA